VHGALTFKKQVTDSFLNPVGLCALSGHFWFLILPYNHRSSPAVTFGFDKRILSNWLSSCFSGYKYKPVYL
jgi:hypothetical protein